MSIHGDPQAAIDELAEAERALDTYAKKMSDAITHITETYEDGTPGETVLDGRHEVVGNIVDLLREETKILFRHAANIIDRKRTRS